MAKKQGEQIWVWIDDPTFGPLQRIGMLSRGDRGSVHTANTRSVGIPAGSPGLHQAFELTRRKQDDLDKIEAREIVGRVGTVVGGWQAHARRLGLSAKAVNDALRTLIRIAKTMEKHA